MVTSITFFTTTLEQGVEAPERATGTSTWSIRRLVSIGPIRSMLFDHGARPQAASASRTVRMPSGMPCSGCALPSNSTEM